MEHSHGGLVQIIFLSKWLISRFHVNLPGCNLNSGVKGKMGEKEQGKLLVKYLGEVPQLLSFVKQHSQLQKSTKTRRTHQGVLFHFWLRQVPIFKP